MSAGISRTIAQAFQQGPRPQRELRSGIAEHVEIRIIITRQTGVHRELHRDLVADKLLLQGADGFWPLLSQLILDVTHHMREFMCNQKTLSTHGELAGIDALML